MKQIVPFKKDLLFKTKVSEITSISLEREIDTSEAGIITGVFHITGDYKMNEGSINRDNFSFDLPFDITLDPRYDMSSVKADIEDFYYDINNTKIFKELLNGIKKSLNILINIFGIITCFLIITKIITLKLNLNPFISSVLSGILEMTTGLKSITSLNIAEETKLLISTFFISFGGLSVHAQIFSMLDDYKVNYFLFLISRLIHASLSVFICLFLYKL